MTYTLKRKNPASSNPEAKRKQTALASSPPASKSKPFFDRLYKRPEPVSNTGIAVMAPSSRLPASFTPKILCIPAVTSFNIPKPASNPSNKAAPAESNSKQSVKSRAAVNKNTSSKSARNASNNVVKRPYTRKPTAAASVKYNPVIGKAITDPKPVCKTSIEIPHPKQPIAPITSVKSKPVSSMPNAVKPACKGSKTIGKLYSKLSGSIKSRPNMIGSAMNGLRTVCNSSNGATTTKPNSKLSVPLAPPGKSRPVINSDSNGLKPVSTTSVSTGAGQPSMELKSASNETTQLQPKRKSNGVVKKPNSVSTSRTATQKRCIPRFSFWLFLICDFTQLD